MGSIYNNPYYSGKYENNKYIWEHETDKNSEAAKRAHEENNAIRSMYGMTGDNMDYEKFRNARANNSVFYEYASDVLAEKPSRAESDRLYNLINNFKYDAESDSAFKAYKNSAQNQSMSAQKNTYANLAKFSGGRNNSYASAATAQVGQAYASKINDYIKTLADEAYEKLITKYKLAYERENQKTSEANDKYNKYIQLGNIDTRNNNNILSGEREIEEHNQSVKQNSLKYDQSLLDMEHSKLKYDMELDNYKSQLIKNNILNEKNIYDYNRWLEDPHYEIKDKKLAEAIGDYMSYSWLKQNGPDYLYSKLYR
ncbi:MAG: hypothetical protein IJQ28_06225 [Clostridia bacterium]|nr:hypothetical protein [Clostridia bacterium]